MCTNTNKTWVPRDEAFRKRMPFDSNTGCEALLKAGITKIFFHGDSFMRQIYAGMLITLNGDFRHGSLANATLAPACEYHKQFNEKKCGTRELNHYGRVCGGKIILDPVLNGFSSPRDCLQQNGSIVLWSFGNYKLTRYGRSGVNNASMYQQFFEQNVCQEMARNGLSGGQCSVYWLSTHARMRAYFEDEKPPVVKEYNLGMRSYFDSAGRCGSVNYIDVFNFTSRLALTLTPEAEQLTYDGVHWGLEVNLLKAQIILHALTTS